jgi:hypothetical protein
MNKNKRKKINTLKLEAHRYVAQNGIKSCKSWERSFFNLTFYRFRNMNLSRQYGLVAMMISYPGMIPIILYGLTNSLSQHLAIGCFLLVFLSVPFWLLACRAERTEL